MSKTKSRTSKDVFSVVWLTNENTHSEDITCMDMIYTQRHRIPVIAAGMMNGSVCVNYGYENITLDSSIRKTTWSTCYSKRHEEAVRFVALISVGMYVLIISASENKLVIRNLLDIDRVWKSVESACGISAMRVICDTKLCIAFNDGKVILVSFAEALSSSDGCIAMKEQTISNFKCVPKNIIMQKGIPVPIQVPFVEICPLENGRVALISAMSYAIVECNDDKNVHVSAEREISGIRCIARQSAGEHLWGMDTGEIVSKRVITANTNVFVSKLLCWVAVNRRGFALALSRNGQIDMIDDGKLIHTIMLDGCLRAFCIKEIGEALFVLHCGKPCLTIPKTCGINSGVIFTPIVYGNRVLKYIPQEHIEKCEVPPESHAAKIIEFAKEICSKDEIKESRARQLIAECYYFTRVVPDYLPLQIAHILDRELDTPSAKEESLDSVVYVLLKCIQAMDEACGIRENSVGDVASALTRCYLGQWSHRHFALHIISNNKDLTKLARKWILAAANGSTDNRLRLLQREAQITL